MSNLQHFLGCSVHSASVVSRNFQGVSVGPTAPKSVSGRCEVQYWRARDWNAAPLPRATRDHEILHCHLQQYQDQESTVEEPSGLFVQIELRVRGSRSRSCHGKIDSRDSWSDGLLYQEVDDEDPWTWL